MEINLKDKLRELRSRKKVTQEAVADHLGINCITYPSIAAARYDSSVRERPFRALRRKHRYCAILRAVDKGNVHEISVFDLEGVRRPYTSPFAVDALPIVRIENPPSSIRPVCEVRAFENRHSGGRRTPRAVRRSPRCRIGKTFLPDRILCRA